TAAPTITQVQPNSGNVGNAVNVTITGTDFVAGQTVVQVSSAGVTVSAVNVTGPTSLTATFTIAANAATGARNVTVTTPSGTSNAATFTVSAAPTITQVQPNSGNAGNAVNVTITGIDFVAGQTTVQVSGAGVTVSAVNVTGPTSLTATFTIAANAATGARNATATTPNGTSNAVTFTVTAAPTITQVQPNSGNVGNAVNVTITGIDFVAGQTSVQTSVAGVTVSAVNVTGPTSLTATFTIAANAATGA